MLALLVLGLAVLGWTMMSARHGLQRHQSLMQSATIMPGRDVTPPPLPVATVGTSVDAAATPTSSAARVRQPHRSTLAAAAPRSGNGSTPVNGASGLNGSGAAGEPGGSSELAKSSESGKASGAKPVRPVHTVPEAGPAISRTSLREDIARYNAERRRRGLPPRFTLPPGWQQRQPQIVAPLFSGPQSHIFDIYRN